jgi:hypothetical protein
VVSGRRDNQLRWRLVLTGEGLSHTGAVRWNKVDKAERTDAVAGELQQRVDDGSQSAGFVFSQHVPLSVHALSTPCSVERDQGAKEQGWVFEYMTFTMGHELAIPLRIRGKLAAKLRESAGNCWPLEET